MVLPVVGEGCGSIVVGCGKVLKQISFAHTTAAHPTHTRRTPYLPRQQWTPLSPQSWHIPVHLLRPCSQMPLPTQSMYGLLIRPWTQMPLSTQSMHWLLIRPCSQMLLLPQSLHLLLIRPCSQMPLPPQSLHLRLLRPFFTFTIIIVFCSFTHREPYMRYTYTLTQLLINEHHTRYFPFELLKLWIPLFFLLEILVTW